MSAIDNAQQQFGTHTTGDLLRVHILENESDSFDDVIDLDGLDENEIKMVFRKPDGTIVIKDAQFQNGSPPATYDNIYYTIDDENLLDQRGHWEYWPQYTLNGNKNKTYDRFSFWVT